jgi:uncharacterized protein (TIGR00251 family)
MTVVAPTAAGCRIRIRAQPRASRTEIAGLQGGALRIRIASPPVGDAANDALIRFLADRLGVPRRRVTLLRGATGSDKTVAVAGVSAPDAAARLGVA